MKRTMRLKKGRKLAPILLSVLLLGAKGAPCAVVSETEALAVADLWYAMELNSGKLKIEKSERQEKLARIAEHEVMYLVSSEELLDHRPDDGATLAYVVTYKPTGFVVVAGEDRIQPIVVFDATSRFRWDNPKVNFLRYFLGREMPKRWQSLREGVHPVWSRLRSRLSESVDQVTFTETERSVFVLWETPLWNQWQYYNDVVIAQNGGTDSIPTGCVATAMAIKMRFHSWPPMGNGSHGYDDTWGDVTYSHFADFGTQSYWWQNMPAGNLTAPNLDVATLMYHCGVAVDMNYEVGGSGAIGGLIPDALNDYFGYRGTLSVDSDFEALMQHSVLGGLPVPCCGGGHCVLADGYRDTEAPFFHLNRGWGGGGDWYDLYSQFPGDTTSTGIYQASPFGSPANYMYVEAGFSGDWDGTIQAPYPTVALGLAAVPAGGHLWIRASRYPYEPVVFDRPMTIRSYYPGGTVLGGRLALTQFALIRTSGAGKLRIY